MALGCRFGIKMILLRMYKNGSPDKPQRRLSENPTMVYFTPSPLGRESVWYLLVIRFCAIL